MPGVMVAIIVVDSVLAQSWPANAVMAVMTPLLL
jgi:hypothetical protein